MPIRYYPALITPETAGFNVVFPDLPGCVTAGNDIQRAAESAAEALSLHVEGMVAEGLPLPSPSPPNLIPDWLDLAESKIAAHVLVPVNLSGKTVRANITIDEGLLSRIDAAAASDGDTRSGWLAQAARDRLHHPR